MRTLSWKNRSVFSALMPAVLALAACDGTPTETSDSPLAAARGGKITFEKIAFASNHEGAFSIYVRELDGFDVDQRVTTPGPGQGDVEPDFAPDNKALVFTRFTNAIAELYTLNLKGNKPVQQLTSFNALTSTRCTRRTAAGLRS